MALNPSKILSNFIPNDYWALFLNPSKILSNFIPNDYWALKLSEVYNPPGTSEVYYSGNCFYKSQFNYVWLQCRLLKKFIFNNPTKKVPYSLERFKKGFKPINLVGYTCYRCASCNALMWIVEVQLKWILYTIEKKVIKNGKTDQKIHIFNFHRKISMVFHTVEKREINLSILNPESVVIRNKAHHRPCIRSEESSKPGTQNDRLFIFQQPSMWFCSSIRSAKPSMVSCLLIW